MFHATLIASPARQIRSEGRRRASEHTLYSDITHPLGPKGMCVHVGLRAACASGCDRLCESRFRISWRGLIWHKRGCHSYWLSRVGLWLTADPPQERRPSIKPSNRGRVCHLRTGTWRSHIHLRADKLPFWTNTDKVRRYDNQTQSSWG